MYGEIAVIKEAFRDEYWDYIRGLTYLKPDFDEGLHRKMTSQASLSHLAFLKPTIERLGIQPKFIQYHDGKANLPYNTGVNSIGEIAKLIEQGYYDGDQIPVVHAIFDGREVIIEFPPLGLSPSVPIAMQISSVSGEGTLESILGGMNSIAGK